MQWPGYWEKDYEITFAKMADIISRYEKLHILYKTDKIYANAQKAISDIGGNPKNTNIREVVDLEIPTIRVIVSENLDHWIDIFKKT